MNDLYLLWLTDFLNEVKETYGSCSILDDLESEDVPSFAKFTQIVWNYNKMHKIENNEL